MDPSADDSAVKRYAESFMMMRLGFAKVMNRILKTQDTRQRITLPFALLTWMLAEVYEMNLRMGIKISLAEYIDKVGNNIRRAYCDQIAMHKGLPPEKPRRQDAP